MPEYLAESEIESYLWGTASIPRCLVYAGDCKQLELGVFDARLNERTQ